MGHSIISRELSRRSVRNRAGCFKMDTCSTAIDGRLVGGRFAHNLSCQTSFCGQKRSDRRRHSNGVHLGIAPRMRSTSRNCRLSIKIQITRITQKKMGTSFEKLKECRCIPTELQTFLYGVHSVRFSRVKNLSGRLSDGL